MKSTSMTDEQLYQYFSGHASSFQKKQIEEWVKEEPHLEQFYQVLAQWEKQNLQYRANTEEALHRHLNRIEKSIESATDHTLSSRSRSRKLRFRWFLAASIVFLLLAGGALYQTTWQYKTYATEYGQTLSLTLPDGSQVILNANSSLRIPRYGFASSTRTVLLRGEAEFSVKHLREHTPFIVKTPKALDVMVLGTEFTVFARERATRVALNSGKVQLSYLRGEQPERTFMKPGELATLNEDGSLDIQTMTANEDSAAWKDHRFVFSSTPLSEIALMLDEVFGTRVVIPDIQVAQMTVTGSFTAHSAEELIQTLAEASALTYQKEKKKIILLSR